MTLTHIHTLLVANRGEIALRVFRTASRLGVTTVAIHTAADEEAPHVHAADEAIEVPSYLDVDAVVAAARHAGADAVHPGYGFLSERAPFARALAEAGIRLVGPTADVMDSMGRKDAARELAVAAGVPVVPRGDDSGFPVLVKAAAGGGGKGMRVVRSADEMDEAVAAAKREALAAFGDDTMLVERYVERGRHVEVQVMGDEHGTVLHLGDRDCSAQRRHQKVLEEAPAPNLPDATRDAMRTAAVDLASHVGYTGAGTVEFLLDPVELGGSGEFYFLEMNTRLQVEHPVTEEVTGLDLVELQLLVADGQALPLGQDDVRLRGHAIEARIYAEDAFGGFLPQAGTATDVVWPTWARVDHALEPGQVVSTAYDPMLGKVIVHAEDREAARQRLVDALDRTAVLGLTTNTGYVRALAASEAFRDGLVDTAWLDRTTLEPPDESGARALAGVVLRTVLEQAPADPWQPDSFRLGGPRGPLVEHGRDLHFEGWIAPPRGTDGTQHLGILGTADGYVRRGPRATEVVVQGHRFVLDRPDPSRRAVGAAGGEVEAPMPGTLLDVRVAVGDEVAEGAVLGVMEAMKMEHTLRAPVAGTVTSVGAAAGATVALGAVLFHVEQP